MLLVALVVGGDTTGLAARAEILTGVKTVAGHFTKNTNCDSLVASSLSLRSIFYQKQIVLLTDGLNSFNIEWLAIEMDTNDCLRARGNLLFDFRHIDLPGVGSAVNKHRRCTGVRWPPCRCNERIGRHNNLIAHTYAQSEHGQVQGRGAVVHSNGVFRTDVAGKVIFEFFYKWTS